jgi:KUP system potassium uptake protein
MRIRHTSASEIGQIYIPAVNWLQLAVVLMAVVGFGRRKAGRRLRHRRHGHHAGHHHPDLLRIRYRWKMNLLCWAATGFFLVIDVACSRPAP